MLPDPRRWTWVLVFVVITMFLVSTALWSTLTSELKHELNQIQVIVRADSLTDAMRFAQPDTTQAP